MDRCMYVCMYVISLSSVIGHGTVRSCLPVQYSSTAPTLILVTGIVNWVRSFFISKTSDVKLADLYRRQDSSGHSGTIVSWKQETNTIEPPAAPRWSSSPNVFNKNHDTRLCLLGTEWAFGCWLLLEQANSDCWPPGLNRKATFYLRNSAGGRMQGMCTAYPVDAYIPGILVRCILPLSSSLPSFCTRANPVALLSPSLPAAE